MIIFSFCVIQYAIIIIMDVPHQLPNLFWKMHNKMIPRHQIAPKGGFMPPKQGRLVLKCGDFVQGKEAAA